MNAIQEIKESYSLEELKEIADHGCQSGLCSQHIYYGDTIKFFETYEDEIVDRITDVYGIDTLVSIFRQAEASLTHYKNDLCWMFIEMVAMEAVDEYDEQVQAEEAAIVNYMGVA